MAVVHGERRRGRWRQAGKELYYVNPVLDTAAAPITLLVLEFNVLGDGLRGRAL